jgi:hypothetical protein
MEPSQYNFTVDKLFKQEPVEPGDAPGIGFGHRKVYLLYCQSYVTDKVQSEKNNPNVACNMSSQYGDHFCEIVIKSNFK